MTNNGLRCRTGHARRRDFIESLGPRRPPEALLWFNPFIAQLDVVCGTETGFGASCQIIGAVTNNIPGPRSTTRASTTASASRGTATGRARPPPWRSSRLAAHPVVLPSSWSRRPGAGGSARSRARPQPAGSDRLMPTLRPAPPGARAELPGDPVPFVPPIPRCSASRTSTRRSRSSGRASPRTAAGCGSDAASVALVRPRGGRGRRARPRRRAADLAPRGRAALAIAIPVLGLLVAARAVGRARPPVARRDGAGRGRRERLGDAIASALAFARHDARDRIGEGCRGRRRDDR